MTTPIYADRVQETTTTSGTGAVSLAGAVIDFQSFGSAFTNGQLVGYALVDGVNWEVGYGTFNTGSPNTLTRTTVLASTNANAAINLSGGATTVWCDAPADFVNKATQGLYPAVDIAGGAANEVVYQTGVATTGFVATPAANTLGVLAQTGAGAPSMQALGVNFTAATTAPTSPVPNVGDRWVNTATGVEYTYFNDGSGNQWVQFF